MKQHVEAAKAIRKELKAKFPNFKFSVTSESFSMGNAVRVYYPAAFVTSEEVHTITDKYQYESKYDEGDCYTYTKNPALPQAMFVTVSKLY